MGTQLGPPKQEPYVQPYAHFPKGNTIGDPVSVEEKGRQWQNYKPDKYFLPNDAIEQDRLDSAHRMMCLALHNILDPSNRPHNPEDVLSLAPIHGDPARVLDIATGTGMWAIEYARRHPSSEVTGSDLSLIQPDVSANIPNVSFVREDAEDEWVYDKPFDLIHARLIFSCFTSHQAVMRKVFENLKPGGWVEYHDMMFNIDSDDLTHRGTGIHKWSHLALAGAAAKGRDMEVARKYKDYMIEAGFVDVTEIKFKLPGNGWPTKQPEQTIGKYTVVSGTEVIKTISDRLLGEGLGLPEDVLRPIIAEAQKDVSDEDIHYWWPGYVVYGRRPLLQESTLPPPK